MEEKKDFKEFVINDLLEKAEELYNDNELEYNDYSSFQYVIHKIKDINN